MQKHRRNFSHTQAMNTEKENRRSSQSKNKQKSLKRKRTINFNIDLHLKKLHSRKNELSQNSSQSWNQHLQTFKSVRVSCQTWCYLHKDLFMCCGGGGGGGEEGVEVSAKVLALQQEKPVSSSRSNVTSSNIYKYANTLHPPYSHITQGPKVSRILRATCLLHPY